jgi:peptide chain release factor 3
VVQYRLQAEYGAESRLEGASWELLRWVAPDVTAAMLAQAVLPSGSNIAYDTKEQPVILFSSDWKLKYFEKQHPAIKLSDVPYKPEKR